MRYSILLTFLPALALADVGITNGTNRAEVNSNLQLRTTSAADGGIVSETQLVGGTSRSGKPQPVDVGPTGRLSVGQPAVAFFDSLDGTVVNPSLWQVSLLTHTVTQPANAILLNAAAVTTINLYSMVTSTRQVQFNGLARPIVEARIKPSTVAEANATMEFGLMAALTNAAPTDGMFFRWNVSGEFRCIASFGGTEATSASLTNPTIDVYSELRLELRDDSVLCYVNENLVATVLIPVGQSHPTVLRKLPMMARVYTAGSAPAVAPQLFIASPTIYVQDLQGASWGEQQIAGSGYGAWQTPLTPFGQTALHTNNTLAAACTASNTAACVTGLGGVFSMTAPAVSAANDWILFDYTVPAGRTLKIYSITCSSYVVTAPAAGGLLMFFAGLESSAVSLVTTDTTVTTAAFAYGARKFNIGSIQHLLAVGSGGSFTWSSGRVPLTVTSRTPTSTSGHFQIIVRSPSITAATVINGACGVTGHFE